VIRREAAGISPARCLPDVRTQQQFTSKITLLKLQALMAAMASIDVGIMRLMTHCAFKVVRFRNMILVRIYFVFLIFLNPFSDHLPRAMILACKTGFGWRGRLWIILAAMAGAARHAAILVPVSRVFVLLGFLGFLTYD
jgi:hypothetical protein